MAAKQPMSTYQDIIELIPNLRDPDNLGSHKYVISPLDIRSRIINNDAEIRGLLAPIYGKELGVTPYLSSPVSQKENQGSASLLPQSNTAELTLTPGAKLSLVYKIEFTSATEFKVSTESTGAQGTGDISNIFTTGDGLMTIDPSLWIGEPAAEDIFYVKLYHHGPMLILLSSLLSASNILNSVYSEQSPNASSAAEAYSRRYKDLMKRILDEELEIDGLPDVSVNLDPIQVDYEIDEFGVDHTNYEDDEWPRRDGGW